TTPVHGSGIAANCLSAPGIFLELHTDCKRQRLRSGELLPGRRHRPVGGIGGGFRVFPRCSSHKADLTWPTLSPLIMILASFVNSAAQNGKAPDVEKPANTGRAEILVVLGLAVAAALASSCRRCSVFGSTVVTNRSTPGTPACLFCRCSRSTSY